MLWRSQKVVPKASGTFIKDENNAKIIVEAISKISVATGFRGVVELKFSYLGCYKSDSDDSKL